MFSVGWYRGDFVFAPELVGREVVLLVNTYMAPMQIFVNGRSVYARPQRANLERFYSIQAAPVRFTVPAERVTLAMRVDTPLMTGVYQLPFELHAYRTDDHSLVGWALWGGELRSLAGWVAFFFGLFFLLVFAKTKYGLYLAAALGSIFGSLFLIIPADYLLALFPIRTLTYLHYVGLWGLLVVTLTTVYFYARAALLRKPGAKTMLVGMLLFFLGALNDTLLAVGVIQSVSLAASALILAIGAMLYVSVQSFANTFVENKRLVGDLREVNENLEGLVAQRTLALREKTNDIQAMLQNMPQGVLTLTRDGRVHPEYSAFLERIYGTDKVAGRDGMEFLFGHAQLGSDARDSLQAAMGSVIGEDAMNFEFNEHLLVQECEIALPEGGSKSLSWSPILGEGDVVDKLMVCVRDVTELKRLAAEAAGQKRELELIGEILAVSQEKFQSFIESSQGFLEDCRRLLDAHGTRDNEVINALFRNLHTIKGNARTYGLLHLTNVVHEAEAAVDLLRKDEAAPWQPELLVAHVDAVHDRLSEYARINDHTLGRKGPGRRGSVEKFLMVDRQQLSDTLQQLQGADRGSLDSLRAAVVDAERTLRLVGTESLQEVLGGLFDGLPALARELGKEPPVVRVEDQGVRVKAQLAGLLRNLFTHLLRNSVDHGLERSGERTAAGKSAQGEIRLLAALAGAGRRWSGPGTRAHPPAGPGPRPDRSRCRLFRSVDRRPDLPARLLHGRGGHRGFGARGRHGRGARLPGSRIGPHRAAFPQPGGCGSALPSGRLRDPPAGLRGGGRLTESHCLGALHDHLDGWADGSAGGGPFGMDLDASCVADPLVRLLGRGARERCCPSISRRAGRSAGRTGGAAWGARRSARAVSRRL